VVQAIPVDEFFVDVGQGVTFVEGAIGRERVQEFVPELREGRLFVAQAFLFDRRTGLRLWSRQAPDYPGDRRLPPDQAFLKGGWVVPPGAPAPTEAERAIRGATAQVPVLLGTFPAAPQVGEESAVAALEVVDRAKDARVTGFFDRGHFMVDASVGWLGGTHEAELRLFDRPPTLLNTGALSPMGGVRGALRIGYVGSSEWFFGGSFQLAHARSGFDRVYVDTTKRFPGIPGAGAARVRVDALDSFGGALEFGPVFFLSEQLQLVPRGSVWAEAVSLSGQPLDRIVAASRGEFGLGLGVELWLRLGEILFTRGSMEFRGGVDTTGRFVSQGLFLIGFGALF